MPPATTEALLLPAEVYTKPAEDHVLERSGKRRTDEGDISILKYDKIDDWKGEIRWPDLIVQVFLHSGAVYGLYLCFYVQYVTILWGESFNFLLIY